MPPPHAPPPQPTFTGGPSLKEREGKGSEWRSASGRRQLQTRTQDHGFLPKPPPTDPPGAPPPPPPLPEPPPFQCPPPLGAFGPLLPGGGVAYRSEETSPPCKNNYFFPVSQVKNKSLLNINCFSVPQKFIV